MGGVEVAKLLAAIVAGYALGALPIGYLVGKAWGVDVRKHGSGRTGGTNVWRATKNLLPVALTVSGDAIKGAAAVLIGRYLLGSELAASLGGAAAVFGHNWSFLLGWKGGAGGMTAGAVLLALTPVAGAIAIPLALGALALSRYASVGTLTIAVGGLVALALLALVAGNSHPPVHILYGFLSCAWVCWALRPNLKRLAEGTERRI
jgi:acyl phosphate:glycerol-3-phosphate acyltransferase